MRLHAIGTTAACVLALAGTARADITYDLSTFTAADSDGGAAITDAEAATFASFAGGYGADEAILGLLHSHGLRTAAAYRTDSAYATVATALRMRVVGLAVSKRQAPGIEFFRADACAPIDVVFDTQGVQYTQVDITYTWDDWQTTGTAALTASGGAFAASLDGAPATGTFRYAVHVSGPDGRDFWLNNPRERGVYGGQAFYNYDLQLAAMAATPEEPTLPAFARMLRKATFPASPGGSVVTNGEFSALVENITWEGGTAVEHAEALRPALDELYDMEVEGVVFEGNVAANMRAFLESQLIDTASYPGAVFSRDADGRLWMSLTEHTAVGARVYYSTDGWNLPKLASCGRGHSGPALRCDLGYIPPGALWSYAIALDYSDGTEYWIRSVLGNFFEALRL